MNQVLNQLLAVHSSRIRDFQAITKKRQLGLLQSALNRTIGPGGTAPEEALLLDTNVGFRKNVSRHLIHSMFRNWTSRMLEVLKLPQQTIQQFNDDDNLMSSYIHLFNSRGEFVRSSQIQCLKLRMGYNKQPIFSILADKLIRYVRESLMKDLMNTPQEVQAGSTATSVIELVGENCQNIKVEEARQTRENWLKTRIVRISRSRKISNPARTPTKTEETEVHLSTQASEGFRLRVKTKCDSTVNRAPSLYGILHLDHEDSFPHWQDKIRLFNCIMDRNRNIRLDIEKYAWQYHPPRLNEGRSRTKIKLKIRAQDKTSHVSSSHLLNP